MLHQHHSAALSAAAVTSADATVLLYVAAAMSFELTFALPLIPVSRSGSPMGRVSVSSVRVSVSVKIEGTFGSLGSGLACLWCE